MFTILTLQPRAMKHKLLALAVLTSFYASSQDRITFNHKDNYEYSMYWKPSTKVNEWDSIKFSHGRAISHQEYIYTGFMNNNEFNGPGKLTGKLMTYTGEWKDGRPHGLGHLVQKQALVDRIEFKGDFVEGRPVRGLYFIVARDKKPTTFYNGEVIFENNKIWWHGFGQVLRMQTGDWDNMGVAGSFYAGQFYMGSATGFGITNTVSSDRRLSNLSTALIMADRVIKEFDTLPLRTEHLFGDEFVAPTSHESLLALLPDYGAARLGNFRIDSLASYTGTTVRNEPYGLGMVKYSDGFIDFGIWKNGKKLDVKDVLDKLLPQQNLLVPWQRQEITRVIKYIPKTKRTPERHEIDWVKKKVTYYAPRNAKGQAEGWGYKIIEDSDSPVQGGLFLGIEPVKKGPFNADPNYLQVKLDLQKLVMPHAYRSQGYVQYSEKSNYFMENSGNWMLVPYLENIGNKSPISINRMPDYRESLSHVAYADHRFYRESVVEYQKADIAQKKAETAAYKKLPELRLKKVFIKRSQPTASYVSDGKTIVKAELVHNSQLKKFDYVLSGEKFKRIQDVFGTYFLLDDNSSLRRNGGESYTAIRNYQLVYQESEWVCQACKGVGGHQSDSKVNIVSGYKNEVNYNTPQTATVTSKPVYTQISGLGGKTPCSACNGDGIRKIKVTEVVVEP